MFASPIHTESATIMSVMCDRMSVPVCVYQHELVLIIINLIDIDISACIFRLLLASTWILVYFTFGLGCWFSIAKANIEPIPIISQFSRKNI